MTVDQKGSSPTLPMLQVQETPTLSHHTWWLSELAQSFVQLFSSGTSSDEDSLTDPYSHPETYFKAVFGATPHTCGRSAIDEPPTQHFR